MNIIKEFLEYRKYKNIYQKIDIEMADKMKLDAFDNGVLEKVYINTMNRIVNAMVNGDLTSQEAKGAKFAIHFFKGFFKNYNLTK